MKLKSFIVVAFLSFNVFSQNKKEYRRFRSMADAVDSGIVRLESESQILMDDIQD